MDAYLENNPELVVKILPSLLMIIVGGIAALIALISLIVKAVRKKKVAKALITLIIAVLVLIGGIFLSVKTSMDLAADYATYANAQNMANYAGATDRITFTSTDKDGTPVDSSVFGDYELTILNRWEPWCGPCKSEMPDLQKLYEEYSGKVNILGIYSDEEDLEETLQSLNVSYPIVKYCEGFAFTSLGGAVPTTVFVDSEGNILEVPEEQRSSTLNGTAVSDSETGKLFDRYAMEGARSYEVWDSLIQGYLAK